MGRLDDAEANLRAGVAVDAVAPPSQMMGWTNSGLAGRLALLEADRGKRKEASDV